MSLLMHTQVNRAETCTKIFSMKRRFHQCTFYLLKIVAYSSMKFILLLKRRKFAIFNHAQTNARFKRKHWNTDMIKRFSNSSSSKEYNGTQGFKIALVLNGYGHWKT